jgi:two-component system vancomycin resistance associated response regulator VraR
VDNPTKVVVVDDQNISRGFFEMYVRAATRYELIAGLRTAREALKYVDDHAVELLILDVMMQDGIDGLSAAEEIKRKHPEIKIILTTSASETSWEEKARDIGIESFWYKEYDEHSLLEIMDRTMEGESVYPGDSPRVPFGKATRADLTDREIEVLRELTGSLTNEEIAEKLHISANTVKRHLQNIMEKTGFESRLDLAMNAKSLGLVVSEEDRTKNRSGDIEEGK